MRTLLVATLAWTLSFAGCFGGEGGSADDGPVTCPDGREVMPGSHEHEAGMEHNDTEEGMSQMEQDPCFIAPMVTLDGLPASLGAYVRDNFTWSIDNGTVPAGHSMLTSFRYSTAPADEATLGGPETWGTELVKFEHNNLPVSFDGQIFFNAAGTYYLRAYAEVRGTGYSSHDYWSEEFALNVTAVLPTGSVENVTHAPGTHVSDSLPVGEFDTLEVSLDLGDGVRFLNEHVQELTIDFSGACPVTQVEVPAATAGGAPGMSVPLVFIEPGLCEATTDEQAPQTVEIRTAVPA